MKVSNAFARLSSAAAAAALLLSCMCLAMRVSAAFLGDASLKSRSSSWQEWMRGLSGRMRCVRSLRGAD